MTEVFRRDGNNDDDDGVVRVREPSEPGGGGKVSVVTSRGSREAHSAMELGNDDMMGRSLGSKMDIAMPVLRWIKNGRTEKDCEAY